MNYHPAHFDTLPAAEDYPDHPLAQPANPEPVQVSDSVYWMNCASNASWVVTDDGVVIIDSGNNRPEVLDAIRATTDKPVRYVVYTHGHVDHTFRQPVYDQIATPQTRVIAHALVSERLSKYESLYPHIGQYPQFFGFFAPPGPRPERATPPPTKYPDVVYHGEYEFELAGRRFQIFHMRAETDDATVVWLPDEQVAFVGDSLISSWPNLGNPYKVPRYGRGWYEGLERVRALKPKALAPGHGVQIITDPAQAEQCLTDQIDGLRYVHDEVVRRLNAGEPHWKMVQEIHLPERLENSPYLQQSYSRVEFAVTAIRRGYTGWYDGDPSDLYPVPRPVVAKALRALVGDDEAILRASKALWDAGDRSAAVEVLQILLRDDESHVEGRRLRLGYMETLLAEDKTLMSRGAWHWFAYHDREFLRGVSG